MVASSNLNSTFPTDFCPNLCPSPHNMSGGHIDSFGPCDRYTIFGAPELLACLPVIPLIPDSLNSLPLIHKSIFCFAFLHQYRLFCHSHGCHTGPHPHSSTPPYAPRHQTFFTFRTCLDTVWSDSIHSDWFRIWIKIPFNLKELVLISLYPNKGCVMGSVLVLLPYIDPHLHLPNWTLSCHFQRCRRLNYRMSNGSSVTIGNNTSTFLVSSHRMFLAIHLQPDFHYV